MNAYLLHTVRPGLNTFEKLLLAHYPKIKVWNMLSDFWIHQTGEKKQFTTECKMHLMQLTAAMQMAGADIIICTCSSLSPYFDEIRKYISIPIVAIDATMARRSLEYGSRILVLASAETAIESAADQIMNEAGVTSQTCQVTPLCCDDAGQIMRSGGDLSEHDRLILDHVKAVKDQDVIVLAQLSTAHLAEKIREICGIPVLTTPMLCIEDLKNYINCEDI